MSRLRVLMIAHGHPDFSKGGAEHAAHHLFAALNRRDDCEAWFIGRSGEVGLSHTGTPFAVRPGGRELLFQAAANHFDFSNTYPRHLWRDLTEFLNAIKPEVVHFHHYTHLGIEMIRAVRNALPDAVIALTLHEFLAICNQNGQMLKTDGTLCRRSSPADCHVCMPGKSPQDFFLRELYVKSFFDLVDVFVSPSHFLKQRYLDWGLPAERITVIENGLPAAEPAPPRPLAGDERRSRFGYFGQITPFKGLEVLLDAFGRLPVALRSEARLEVHGGGQHWFTEDFQQRIDDKLRQASRSVRYYGPYAPEDLAGLMRQVDWVVIPSIWWENSPLVIQEAFRHQRPVICGDIGGMAEKVAHQRTGLHFRTGNPTDLADRLREAVETEGLWDRLRSAIEPPPDSSQCAQRHLLAYRRG